MTSRKALPLLVQIDEKSLQQVCVIVCINSFRADYNSLSLCDYLHLVYPASAIRSRAQALTNKQNERTWNCQMYNLITHTFLSLLTINWMENYIRIATSRERSGKVMLLNVNELNNISKSSHVTRWWWIKWERNEKGNAKKHRGWYEVGCGWEMET